MILPVSSQWIVYDSGDFSVFPDEILLMIFKKATDDETNPFKTITTLQCVCTRFQVVICDQHFITRILQRTFQTVFKTLDLQKLTITPLECFSRVCARLRREQKRNSDGIASTARINCSNWLWQKRLIYFAICPFTKFGLISNQEYSDFNCELSKILQSYPAFTHHTIPVFDRIATQYISLPSTRHQSYFFRLYNTYEMFMEFWKTAESQAPYLISIHLLIKSLDDETAFKKTIFVENPISEITKEQPSEDWLWAHFSKG